MLELKNVTKRFSKFKAVDDFSFKFEENVYALLGPNGAGKTTLLRCLTNLYPLDGGEINFNGVSINKKGDLPNIGYLPQTFGLFRELKVKEAMELIANMKKISRNESEASVREALGLVNLEDRVESRISSLSGGMVRRLGIAQALMGDPGIIVLDEPTAGLDPEERLRFKNTVNKIKKNKTIIISTHIVDDVEAVCDRIVIVNNGKFVKSGSCEEIRNTADGKTYVLESDRQKEIQSDYELAGQFEADGVNMVKVLSKTPLPYRKTAPQLEDGYLCALKGI